MSMGPKAAAMHHQKMLGVVKNPPPIDTTAPGYRLFDWEVERMREFNRWLLEMNRAAGERMASR